ncbi:MAG: hypothetical protein ACE14V_09350 [bacterium]
MTIKSSLMNNISIPKEGKLTMKKYFVTFCFAILLVAISSADLVAIDSTLKATDPNGIPLKQYSIVTVAGVVWSPTNQDPSRFQRYIQDTGTGLGVLIDGTDSFAVSSCTTFTRGDLMYAVGSIYNYSGLFEIALMDTTAYPQNLGVSPIAPSIITAANILDGMSFDSTIQTGGEFYEGRPFAFSNVTVLQTMNVGTTRDFNIAIGDVSSNTTGGYIVDTGGSQYVWRIDKDTDIDEALAGRLLIRGTVLPVLVGAGCQYKSGAQSVGGYQIISQAAADFTMPTELGRLDTTLRWMWSNATTVILNGSNIYRGVTIQTSRAVWPDLAIGADAIRNFAYSTANNHIYFNSVRTTDINVALKPMIMDAANGAVLGSLDTTGISGGTFIIAAMGADDYGAIYGCNLSTKSGSDTTYKIYKWTNEAAVPTLIYSNNVLPGRTGDRMNVQTMSDGSVKIIATGSSNSTILIINGDGSLFASVTTNIYNTSPGIANIDPDTGDIWYKRWGMATYVIPSTTWMPATVGGASFVNCLTQSTVIGTDLIPQTATSFSIVKRFGIKFLVTEDGPGRIINSTSNGVASAHAIVFDITSGIPSPTGLTPAETKYWGRTDSTIPIGQIAGTIDGVAYATIDRNGNILHLVENMALASWSGTVGVPVELSRFAIELEK